MSSNPILSVTVVLALLLISPIVLLQQSDAESNSGTCVAYDGGTYTYETFSSPSYRCTITDYELGLDDFVRIQNRLEGFPVTTLADESFSNCDDVRTFVVPESVKSVGSGVFNGCKHLTNIIFLGDMPEFDQSWSKGMPSEVTITYLDLNEKTWEGFVGFKTSITKTNTYESDDCSFSYIFLDDSVTILRYISGTEITVPSELPVDGKMTCVKYIGPSSFQCIEYGEKPMISSVTLCEGIEFIDVAAFKYCEYIEKINFPSTLKVIMDEAFRMPIDNTDWSKSKLSAVDLPYGLEYIGFEAFRMCYSLKTVTVPDSVTHYGDGAFRVCTSMEAIKIGKNIHELGEFSLDNCFSLKEVSLPDGLTSIGNNCFNLDRSLQKITIPNSVAYIDENAFGGCTSLQDISLPGIIEISNSAFSECPLQTIKVTSGPIGSCLMKSLSSDWVFGSSSLKTSLLIIDTTDEVSLDFEGKKGSFICISGGSINTVGGTFVDGGKAVYGKDRSGKTFSYDENWKSANVSTLHVFSSSTALGTVTGAGSYISGETVTIIAKSKSYCEFIKWSDGSKDSVRTIELNTDKTLTAEFKKSEISVLKVNIMPEKGGRCDEIGKYVKGETVEINANPNKGYHFIRWDDGYREASRVIVMEKDVTLTAYFGNVTLTFKDNKETILQTDYSNEGWEFIMPTITKDGKKTITWIIEGKEYAAGASYTVKGDVEAVAVWGETSSSNSLVLIGVVASIITILALVLIWKKTR